MENRAGREGPCKPDTVDQKGNDMKKIAFTLEIPESEPRKKQPPVARVHRDRKSYSRKTKHKARQEQSSPDRNYSGDFFIFFLQSRNNPAVVARQHRGAHWVKHSGKQYLLIPGRALEWIK